MVDAGLIVIVSFISPFRAERQMARSLFEPDEFLERKFGKKSSQDIQARQHRLDFLVVEGGEASLGLLKSWPVRHVRNFLALLGIELVERGSETA